MFWAEPKQGPCRNTEKLLLPSIFGGFRPAEWGLLTSSELISSRFPPLTSQLKSKVLILMGKSAKERVGRESQFSSLNLWSLLNGEQLKNPHSIVSQEGALIPHPSERKGNLSRDLTTMGKKNRLFWRLFNVLEETPPKTLRQEHLRSLTTSWKIIP